MFHNCRNSPHPLPEGRKMFLTRPELPMPRSSSRLLPQQKTEDVDFCSVAKHWVQLTPSARDPKAVLHSTTILVVL